MNREINFRAISEETGKMRHGSLTVEYDGTCHINWWESILIEPENNYHEPAPFFEVVKKETIGQYTGLKDKNGKEIYEGDVLNFGNNNNVLVVFENGCFSVFGEPLGWDFDTERQPIKTEFKYCELVGNIHENPELL